MCVHVCMLSMRRERKDTCVVTAVNLAIRRKKLSVLWSTSGLPADAFSVVAVPDKPAALVLCLNHVVYCHQVGQYEGLVDG